MIMSKVQGNSLKNKRVLITGANGFIGRKLVNALVGKSGGLFLLDLHKMDTPPDALSFEGDLMNPGFISDVVNRHRPQIVFHLAAFKDRTSQFTDLYKAVNVNLVGSLNLFGALRQVDCLESVIVMGTAEEYGANKVPFSERQREEPVSAYSFSKTCLSHLCGLLHKLYRMPAIVLRPTVAYGPGQEQDMFLPSLIISLLKGKPFEMTAGKQRRDFLYIDDLVRALLLLPTSAASAGKIINIGTGSSIVLGELARKVQKIIGKNDMVILGARDYRPGEIMEYSISLTSVRRLIDWMPAVSLEEGLNRTIAYYRENLDLYR